MKQKIFWLAISAVIVSILEIGSYIIIYTEGFWENIPKKIGLFIPQLIYFAGLLYTCYFFISIWQIIQRQKNNVILKIIFFFYYLMFVWCISYHQYTSPISYTGSILYNGVVKGEWIDTKSLIRKTIGAVNA